MAAPEGNTNSSVNNRLWANTIRRAVTQADGERLRRIAEAMLAKAEDGDMNAIKEMGDRLDGKAAQAIVGADGGDLTIKLIQRVIVDNPNN